MSREIGFINMPRLEVVPIWQRITGRPRENVRLDTIFFAGCIQCVLETLVLDFSPFPT